jgi:hypothetical protein
MLIPSYHHMERQSWKALPFTFVHIPDLHVQLRLIMPVQSPIQSPHAEFTQMIV